MYFHYYVVFIRHTALLLHLCKLEMWATIPAKFLFKILLMRNECQHQLHNIMMRHDEQLKDINDTLQQQLKEKHPNWPKNNLKRSQLNEAYELSLYRTIHSWNKNPYMTMKTECTVCVEQCFEKELPVAKVAKVNRLIYFKLLSIVHRTWFFQPEIILRL